MSSPGTGVQQRANLIMQESDALDDHAGARCGLRLVLLFVQSRAAPCGVGCCGLAFVQLVAHAAHGLHGRHAAVADGGVDVVETVWKLLQLEHCTSCRRLLQIAGVEAHVPQLAISKLARPRAMFSSRLLAA